MKKKKKKTIVPPTDFTEEIRLKLALYFLKILERPNNKRSLVRPEKFHFSIKDGEICTEFFSMRPMLEDEDERSQIFSILETLVMKEFRSKREIQFEDVSKTLSTLHRYSKSKGSTLQDVKKDLEDYQMSLQAKEKNTHLVRSALLVSVLVSCCCYFFFLQP